MELAVYQIDAFANKIFQGNPAAVMPLTEWLDDATLQSIAQENNLSETVYFVGDNGKYHIRWFTPNKEVKLCGHATLASAKVIFEILGYEGEQIEFTSLSGSLFVVKKDGLLEMDFPAKNLGADVSEAIAQELAEALGATPKSVLKTDDLFAVFDSQAEVAALQPNFNLLEKIDCRGIIVTAPGDAHDMVSRFFAPKAGINEDPVTGSAHCVLTPYWADKLGKTKLKAKQISPRGGEVQCELQGDRVKLAGEGILFLQGKICI